MHAPTRDPEHAPVGLAATTCCVSFAPNVRLARNFGQDFALAIEYYTDLGPIGHFLPFQEQRHNIYGVVDFKVDRLEVEFGGPRPFLIAYSENISRGGIFVATHLAPPIGEIVELAMTLPDGGPPVVVKCRVAHHGWEHHGVGLEFMPDAEFGKRIERCFESLLTVAVD